MKLFVNYVLTFLFIILSSKAVAIENDNEVNASNFKVLFNKSQKKITIKKNTGSIIQVIELENSSNEESTITIADFNFDGADDISVSGDEGNVQRFSSVYLFSKSLGRFELSKQFSEIPCIAIDSKKKTVSGECFHASACENWVEKYSVGRQNKLNIIEKKGFFCEPANDRSYKYTERYRNGKLIQNRVTEIKP